MAEHQIHSEELGPDSFAPYGRVIQQPAAAADAGGDNWKWWGELTFMACAQRPYGLGYLALEPGELRFDWAERHMRSPELLAPLTGECLIYVAPPDHLDQPDRLPPHESFRVFHVRPGQAVLLHSGVWHGVPLAVGAPAKVLVLLLQGTGANDLTLVRFEDDPITIVNGASA